MGLVAEVERELAEQWRVEPGEENAVTRACAHNLIVMCESSSDDVSPIVAQLSQTAPGRALIVKPALDDAAKLTAFVSANCHKRSGGKVVCSEQVVLEAGREAMMLVPASVLQLLVEELPVYLWWRRPLRGDNDLLLGLSDLADCLVVDGARFEDPLEALTLLQRIVSNREWKGHAADLAWARLDPWREAVAAFFDAPRMRPLLAEIRRVKIAAGCPYGAYLAGWLASRLEWPSHDVVELDGDTQLPSGEPASVRIDAGAVTFVVERVGPAKPTLVATVEAADSCPLPRRIVLPERDEVALMCDVLQQPTRDVLFASALDAAARMTGNGETR